MQVGSSNITGSYMITCNILLHRLFRLQYVRFYLFSLTEQKYDRTGETSYGQVHLDGGDDADAGGSN